MMKTKNVVKAVEEKIKLMAFVVGSKLRRTVSAFRSIIPMHNISNFLYGGHFSEWCASENAEVYIKQIGKHGLLKEYEIGISSTDYKNTIYMGESLPESPREFSITITVESLLSINKLKSLVSGSTEIGVLTKNDSMFALKIGTGKSRYMVNYTSPKKWECSYEKGLFDIKCALLSMSKTVKFDHCIVVK